MFSEEFDRFLEQQKSEARGQRLEMLNKNLSGTRRMLEAMWPALKSFQGITLEPLGFALESEGFAVHAEKITRDRFDFEKVRVRTMDAYNYKYVPYSRDELGNKPEWCLRDFYELLGRFSSSPGGKLMELTVYEREMLRYAECMVRPLRLEDVKFCLQSDTTAPGKLFGHSWTSSCLSLWGKAGSASIHSNCCHFIESICCSLFVNLE
jgi:hypothetical protein